MVLRFPSLEVERRWFVAYLSGTFFFFFFFFFFLNQVLLVTVQELA